VLTACGQTLKKLVLEDFTEIDVQQVFALNAYIFMNTIRQMDGLSYDTTNKN
jgi:hypothetical protein